VARGNCGLSSERIACCCERRPKGGLVCQEGGGRASKNKTQVGGQKGRCSRSGEEGCGGGKKQKNRSIMALDSRSKNEGRGSPSTEEEKKREIEHHSQNSKEKPVNKSGGGMRP